MKVTSYKDLIIWQKSMDLVLEIYCITKKFPKNEVYGLASQMRRAAVSIPSNISEGYKRNHPQMDDVAMIGRHSKYNVYHRCHTSSNLPMLISCDTEGQKRFEQKAAKEAKTDWDCLSRMIIR